MKNNDGAGATQPKGGDNAKAINRHSGYKATVSSIESKTRSRHHSGGTAYHYTGACCGYGSNENIKGYGS
jgi:hypothetical protein